MATNGGNDPKSKRTQLGYDLVMTGERASSSSGKHIKGIGARGKMVIKGSMHRGAGASASTGKIIGGSGAIPSKEVRGLSVKGSMQSERLEGRGR